MGESEKTGRPLSVLFIGNSYTHFNAMPQMLERLAAAGQGQPVRARRITPGGCSLEKHWTVTGAPDFIRDGGWDYVILQARSLSAIEDPLSVRRYARLFDRAIRKAGARTVLYMTWARQHAPELQQTITAAYLAIGRQCGALVAPVGEAWKRVLAGRRNLALHGRDGSHPNRIGSYLAACVFYATIHGKSPEGLPGRLTVLDEDGSRRVLIGLARDRAAYLQRTAWQAVRALRPNRRR